MQRELSEAKLAISHHNFDDEAPVRLGVQPMIAASLLSAPFSELLRTRLHTRVAIKERANSVLPELVLNQEVDACLITENHLHMPDLTLSPLIPMRYAAFVPQDHVLAGRSKLSFQQLLPYRLVIFNETLDMQARIMRASTISSKEARIVFHSDQALTVLQMAAHGVGIAILPEFLQKLPLAQNLKAIPLRDASMQTRISAAWRTNHPPPPLLQEL